MIAQSCRLERTPGSAGGACDPRIGRTISEVCVLPWRLLTGGLVIGFVLGMVLGLLRVPEPVAGRWSEAAASFDLEP